NSYQNSGGLSIISNDLIIGSNNTGNPIRLQGAPIVAGPAEFRSTVAFNSTVTGLNLSIGNISGLRAELDSIWNSLSGKSPIGHTHSVTLPTHNHGLSGASNWGGTFPTSSA
ncbi:hypothetical protein SAMN06272722_11972, partial [Paenibacillus sp. RU5A]